MHLSIVDGSGNSKRNLIGLGIGLAVGGVIVALRERERRKEAAQLFASNNPLAQQAMADRESADPSQPSEPVRQSDRDPESEPVREARRPTPSPLTALEQAMQGEKVHGV